MEKMGAMGRGKEVKMDNSYYWDLFQQSGNIMDYLHYTACTDEDIQSKQYQEGMHGESCDRDGDGISSHASWRL